MRSRSASVSGDFKFDISYFRDAGPDHRPGPRRTTRAANCGSSDRLGSALPQSATLHNQTLQTKGKNKNKPFTP